MQISFLLVAGGNRSYIEQFIYLFQRWDDFLDNRGVCHPRVTHSKRSKNAAWKLKISASRRSRVPMFFRLPSEGNLVARYFSFVPHAPRHARTSINFNSNRYRRIYEWFAASGSKSNSSKTPARKPIYVLVCTYVRVGTRTSTSWQFIYSSTATALYALQLDLQIFTTFFSQRQNSNESRFQLRARDSLNLFFLSSLRLAPQIAFVVYVAAAAAADSMRERVRGKKASEKK